MNSHDSEEIPRPMSELLPCPFCGNAVEVGENDKWNPPLKIFSTQCEDSNCPCVGFISKDTPEFRSIWNTRHQPQAQSDVDSEEFHMLLIDVLIKGVRAWNQETVAGIIDLFRPYLTQRPVGVRFSPERAMQTVTIAHLLRSWTEDYSHENGNYTCLCCECGLTFTGHKRRVACKECVKAKDDAAQTPYTEKGER
jgi:hypothetical protein